MSYGYETWNLFSGRNVNYKRWEKNWRWRGTKFSNNLGLHNEKLHGLYRSDTTIRIVKCGRLRLAGYGARMEKTRSIYKIFMGNLLENGHLQDQ
jgi:hypothetical protein